MTSAAPGPPRVAVLVPVKAFSGAKARLAPTISSKDREALVRAMAEAVLRAARPLPVSVVCDDATVAAWACSNGAGVVWTPARGLNGAVTHGVAVLAAAGATTVIVAHADLPLANELAPVAHFEGVTLVPDRRDDGTNVAAVPTAAGFRFSYGPGSFGRHVAECERLGLAIRILREPLLSWDVDLPADLLPAERPEPDRPTPAPLAALRLRLLVPRPEGHVPGTGSRGTTSSSLPRPASWPSS